VIPGEPQSSHNTHGGEGACRIYEVGRRRPAEDDSDQEDAPDDYDHDESDGDVCVGVALGPGLSSRMKSNAAKLIFF
jgi:hypothetical protein